MPAPRPRSRTASPSAGRATTLLVPLLAWCATSTAVGQAPAPSPLDSLGCKVLNAHTPTPGTILFEVEVRNSGDRTAEPGLFAVRVGKPAELHRIERCPLPYAGRVGRGIAAHGLERYHLQIASTAAATSLVVEIVAATFRDEPPADVGPVQIGELRQGLVTLGGRAVAATYLGLRNLGNQPVDAVLLATFARPHRSQALVTARLRAGQVTELDVAIQPTELVWNHPRGDEGVEITKVELVDWCTYDPAALGDANLTAPLLTAYEHWHGWREPWPSGEGTFCARFARSSLGDGASLRITGRFMLKDVAPPLVSTDAALDLEPLQALDRAIEAAFADLRRPGRAAFAERSHATLQDRDRYLVAGPCWHDPFGRLIDVADQRIVGTAEVDAPGSNWQHWLLQDWGTDYLVVGRTTHQLAAGPEPTVVERRTYTQSGAWLVPLSYRRDSDIGGFRESIAIAFACGPLHQPGAIAATTLGGPGATALQAAWDNGYRYPDVAVALGAKWEVTTPGGDELWLGQRHSKGRLTAPTFGGFRMDGQGLDALTVQLDGVRLAAANQDRLGWAVAERLRQWSLRDLAGRPPFATALQGATIVADPARPGVFTLGNCAIAEVEVRAGLIARLRWTSGLERTYDWQKCGDAMVPTRIATGAEVLSATWKQLPRGWLLPTELRFERLYRDAATETLRLGDVTLR